MGSACKKHSWTLIWTERGEHYDRPLVDMWWRISHPPKNSNFIGKGFGISTLGVHVGELVGNWLWLLWLLFPMIPLVLWPLGVFLLEQQKSCWFTIYKFGTWISISDFKFPRHQTHQNFKAPLKTKFSKFKNSKRKIVNIFCLWQFLLLHHWLTYCNALAIHLISLSTWQQRTVRTKYTHKIQYTPCLPYLRCPLLLSIQPPLSRWSCLWHIMNVNGPVCLPSRALTKVPNPA